MPRRRIDADVKHWLPAPTRLIQRVAEERTARALVAAVPLVLVLAALYGMRTDEHRSVRWLMALIRASGVVDCTRHLAWTHHRYARVYYDAYLRLSGKTGPVRQAAIEELVRRAPAEFRVALDRDLRAWVPVPQWLCKQLCEARLFGQLKALLSLLAFCVAARGEYTDDPKSVRQVRDHIPGVSLRLAHRAQVYARQFVAAYRGESYPASEAEAKQIRDAARTAAGQQPDSPNAEDGLSLLAEDPELWGVWGTAEDLDEPLDIAPPGTPPERMRNSSRTGTDRKPDTPTHIEPSFSRARGTGSEQGRNTGQTPTGLRGRATTVTPDLDVDLHEGEVRRLRGTPAGKPDPTGNASQQQAFEGARVGSGGREAERAVDKRRSDPVDRPPAAADSRRRGASPTRRSSGSSPNSTSRRRQRRGASPTRQTSSTGPPAPLDEALAEATWRGWTSAVERVTGQWEVRSMSGRARDRIRGVLAETTRLTDGVGSVAIEEAFGELFTGYLRRQQAGEAGVWPPPEDLGHKLPAVGHAVGWLLDQSAAVHHEVAVRVRLGRDPTLNPADVRNEEWTRLRAIWDRRRDRHGAPPGSDHHEEES